MKNKRSETAAYHRRRVATAVGPKAEPKILINLEGSDRVHPTKKFVHVHLEGGDAARIAASGHITDAVATPLQRKDPAVSHAATRSAAVSPSPISSAIRAIWRSTSV